MSQSILVTGGAGYVGSHACKSLAGAGRSIWSNQMPPKHLALGTLLQANVTPAVVAQAQAQFSEIRLPYSNFAGALSQMLRLFPQYPGLGDPFGNVGQSNYNAFQVIANQRLAHGVTMMLNYTFSLSFNNVSGGRSAYDWSSAKTLSNVDQPHLLNAIFAYDLPWGKGRTSQLKGVVGLLGNDWKVLASPATQRAYPSA